MSDSYIPPTDAGALAWMRAFRNGIMEDPAKYGLSEADSLAIDQAVNDFEYWMEFNEEPGQKTKVSVLEKDDARTAAEQICRGFAVSIKYNSGISDPDKIDIGVRPVNNSRDPIFVPQTSPILSLIGSTPSSQTLRFADSTTPASKKKPFGAANLQLFVAVDDQVTTDWNKARFVGAFTKNPIGVLFQPEDNQKVATYYARWASRTGDVGPWSIGTSFTIAA